MATWLYVVFQHMPRTDERSNEIMGTGLLSRTLLLRRGEAAAMCWSAGFFFFVLFSYSMLRPVREAMGIEKRYEDLTWLMTGTLVVMLFANPVFAWLVSAVPRRRFIPITYRFFAISMLAFYLMFRFLPEESRVGLGYAIYIWLSVFNLFVVSVFWAFMADIFNHDQAKRLFGFIAVGGTLGALAGPLLTGILVKGFDLPGGMAMKMPSDAMLLVSGVSLEVAVQCVKRLLRLAGIHRAELTSPAMPVAALQRGTDPGPGLLEGLCQIMQSPLLLLICGFMLIFTILSSLLYMEQGRIVAQTFATNSDRTAAFAQLDVYTQSLTLVLQLLLTGRIIRFVGVGGTLTIVPLVTMIGFAALMWRDTWAVFAVVMVFRRAFHYALDRPAREVLYTVVSADAKYKSKSFIDTFVYRGGDAVGGWMERLLTWMSVATGVAAIPLAAMGFVGALGLGYLQRKRVDEPPQKTE